MRELSLYIHIPFCVKKCDYCDFLSAPATVDVQEQYLHALFQEIRKRSEAFREYRVKSIFIGGGTPSVLAPARIEELMNVVQKQFHILENAEISMEMNPGSIQGKEALEVYRRAGLNRLSIGLQSTNDEELRLLGRIHTFSEFERTWQYARESGFDNLNIDLMSALPRQTIESYRNSLEKVCALQPEHISAYSLIIEEGTPFYERYASLCEDEEQEERDRKMYLLTEEILRANGYERYEISNYAKPGKECRHNLVYWTRGEYLGVGIGAASMIDNARYSNTRDINKYIQASGMCLYEEVQKLSLREQMEEFMFLGLRLTKGISKKEFLNCFGCTVESVFGEVLSKNQKDGLLEMNADRVFLTSRGLDISNYVFAQFLE